MTPLANSGHAQLAALWLGCVGWTLTGASLGLVQWRVWLVPNSDAISSGVAWVGIWRTCFNSYTLVTPGFQNMHCTFMRTTADSTPPDIMAGQILMVLSLGAGLCGNAGGVYGLRKVAFGMKENSRTCFLVTGGLLLSAAGLSLVTLLWNLSSVVNNQTIRFTPEFMMPPAPNSQHVGCGLAVGLVGAVLMVASGVLFCKYRLPRRPWKKKVRMNTTVADGNENLAFEL